MTTSEPTPEPAQRRGAILGTFLICCALLAFEISTVRTINFAIGPSYIFIAIALAMLGLTAAGSLLSLFDLRKIRWPRATVLAVLCLAIAVLLVLCNVLVVSAKAELAEIIREGGRDAGLDGIVRVLLLYGPVHAGQIGLFLTLPYFLFGALLSYLFSTAPPRDYSVLYAADLLGAALGCMLIILVMEFTGYAVSITAPILLAILAAAAYLIGSAQRGVWLCIVLAVAMAGLSGTEKYRQAVEPSADPSYLVRDYAFDTDHVERWTGWNSFTRVAAVEEAGTFNEGAILSLANGDGMAFVLPNNPTETEPVLHPPVIPALIADPGNKALVIFAGAGADMKSLRAHGVEHVVGVELNGKVLEAGLALPEYDLQAFLDQDGVDLHIDEARSFLERDDQSYDQILLSWSGATINYHAGALGGTTQHLFTYEGLEAILDNLNEDGRAVILQVNKLDTLSGLRRYMSERGLTSPERAAIVLFSEDMNHDWDAAWDNNPLLIRLKGWSDKDVARIKAEAAQHDFQIAYAPHHPTHPDFGVYERILTSADPDAEIAEISEEANRRFGIATDDRPFFLDHFKPSRYLASEFWFRFPEPYDTAEDLFHFVRVVFVLMVAGIAFLLAVAPLLFAGRKTRSRGRSATYLGYFSCLGAGFMFIEIALIQRAGIVFGNPGMTIAVVLGAVILTTGLGSLMSNASMARGFTINRISLLIALYAVLAALLAPVLIDAVIGASLAVRLITVLALIAPGGILMGHLFPQGLVLAGNEDPTLIPWAWAINGAMSASVAGIAPLVAQAGGFGLLFYIGAALYLCVLLLPITKPGSVTAQG